MHRISLSNFLGWGLGFLFFLTFNLASANSPFDITFPVSELNNCADQANCKIYCDNLENKDNCFIFAQKHGFVSKRDSQKRDLIKKVMKKGGPGGCKSQSECRSYCENQDNFKVCLDFAENNGFVSKEQAKEIKKLPPIGPGGCRGKECRTFCENHDNQEECFKFAEKNNLIPKEEIERNRKAISATRDGGPGGCRGKECRVFCEKEENRETCLEFAKKHDLIPAEELKRMEEGRRIKERFINDQIENDQFETDEEGRFVSEENTNQSQRSNHSQSENNQSERSRFNFEDRNQSERFKFNFGGKNQKDQSERQRPGSRFDNRDQIENRKPIFENGNQPNRLFRNDSQRTNQNQSPNQNEYIRLDQNLNPTRTTNSNSNPTP